MSCYFRFYAADATRATTLFDCRFFASRSLRGREFRYYTRLCCLLPFSLRLVMTYSRRADAAASACRCRRR